MDPDQLNLVISVFGAVLAAFAVGWNIYRDIIMKPRVKVNLSLSQIMGSQSDGSAVRFSSLEPGQIDPREAFVSIDCVNHGPGKIRLTSIVIRRPFPFHRSRTFISHDPNHICSHSLPMTLEQGDGGCLVLPYNAKINVRILMGGSFARLAVVDVYGRRHWASSSDFRKLQKLFRSDFGGLRSGEQPEQNG